MKGLLHEFLLLYNHARLLPQEVASFRLLAPVSKRCEESSRLGCMLS